MSDLNRRIAEALGYRMEQRGGNWYLCGGHITKSDGFHAGVQNEANAWANMYNEGVLLDYEHDLNAAHEVVASVLSYRITHQYTLGGVQGGLELIIESVNWPEGRHRLNSPDDAAPYLLERWLEIQAAWLAWKGQGDG